MTLLIGTLSKNHVVLTSDGRCVKETSTQDKTILDNYQKIFPFLNLPLAIAHHGQNIINGLDIKKIIYNFSNHNIDFSKSSILEICNFFKDFLNEDAKMSLSSFANPTVIGFWITGFSPGADKPEFYEICWPDNIEPQSHKGLIIGGNGKKFINSYLFNAIGKYRPEKIKNCKVNYACIYQDKLYKIALEEQSKQGDQIIGGHKHRLVILKQNWRWEIEPPG